MQRRRKLGGIMRANHEAGRPIFEGIEQFIFYGDLIDSNRQSTFDANSLFREILRDYPDTILLLNLRDREAWIRSRLKHGHGEFAEREQQLRGLHSLEALCDCWRDEWDLHISAVRTFMAERPQQLVEFNIDTDPVEMLAARLPAFALNPDDFVDIGRSRGRHLPGPLKTLKAWMARHKLRAQR